LNIHNFKEVNLVFNLLISNLIVYQLIKIMDDNGEWRRFHGTP